MASEISRLLDVEMLQRHRRRSASIQLEGQTGQTVGKKALGIRLVRETDGQPLGVGMAFVRRLAHFLDSLACYLGWLWPAWDAKRQTFADKVCSSIVIRTN